MGECSALPLGWERVPLGDVADLALGKMLDKAKRAAGTPMQYLRNINVRWHGFDVSDLFEMPFEPHEVERYSVHEGDVVVCEGGEPGRAAVWRGPTIMFQKALHRVRPREGAFDPRWLVWHLRHDAASGRLAGSFTGTTIKHLTGSALARYEILLPPLTEQRRIVAKLDGLLASSRAARAALDEVPALLHQYRQAVLAAACDGVLGAHDGSTSDSWRTASLGDLSALVTSGSRGWSEYYASEGSIFIRSQDINEDRLSLDRVAHVSLPDHVEGRRTRVQRGDLLITITGANVGKVARVDVDLSDAYVSQHVALVRLADSSQSEYLHLWLTSERHGRGQLLRSAYGGGKPGLNLGNVRAAEVRLPTAPEQVAIVAKVAEKLQAAAQQQSRIVALRADLSQLESSILSAAFCGELVAQDPADEPASVLLERIQAERAEVSVRRPRRRAARA
jgi:type I restriction enzyme S subunit